MWPSCIAEFVVGLKCVNKVMVVFGFSKIQSQTSHTPTLPSKSQPKWGWQGSNAPHFAWLTEAGNKCWRSVASSASESGLLSHALFCGLYPSCLFIWLAQCLWTHYDPLHFSLPLSLSFLACLHSWSLSTILINTWNINFSFLLQLWHHWLMAFFFRHRIHMHLAFLRSPF